MIMHILEMHICAYSVLHISKYFLHIYAYGYLHTNRYLGFVYTAYKYIYCIFHLCILCIFSACLVLHILAYFDMLISASWCIICIYMCIFWVCLHIYLSHFIQAQPGANWWCGILWKVSGLIQGKCIQNTDWQSLSIPSRS